MKFTRLKIIGFKSFVDTTILDIKSGLTGLVGPNGCGKSNIVEAIKWNMGEAGPSKLRAGEMDDVIFSGTNGRPARNSAEVILNLELENIDTNNKFSNNEQIEISRKIDKNEGSTYKVNYKEVRQRDVQILFADYALGSRSNAIVDQGQISRIINSKPIERRLIIEEASGITGVHARRHETELKLKATENNLGKLEEIISNDKIRLRELSKQTSQAKRYKNLSDKIRNTEAIILFHKWNNSLSNIENIKNNLMQYNDKADTITGKISNITLKMQNSESSIIALRDNYQNHQSILNKLQLEHDLLDKEKESIDIEIESINNNTKSLEQELYKEKKLFQNLSKQQTEISEEITRVAKNNPSKNLDLLKSNMEKAQKQESEQYNIFTEAQNKLSNHNTNKENLITIINKLKIEYTNLEKEKNINEVEIKKLTEKNNDNDKNYNHENEIKNNKIKLHKNEEIEIKYIEDIKDNNIKIQDLKNSLKNKMIEHNNLQKEIDQLTASKNILTKLFESNEKNIVINNISFPNGYEKAIEAALGHGLKASLNKSPIEWRSIKQRELKLLPKNIKNLEKITKGVNVVSNILKSTGIVTNKEEGDKLQNYLKPGQQLVSVKGDLWRWDGYTHTAEAETPANQILQNKKNLEKINNNLTKLNKKFKYLLNDINIIENNIKDLESQNQKNISKINNINILKNNLVLELESIQQKYSLKIEINTENKTKLSILEKSQANLDNRLKIITQELKNNELDLSAIPNKSDLEKKVEEISESNNKIRKNLNIEISNYQKELSAIENQEKQILQLNNEFKRLKIQLESISDRINYLTTNIFESNNKISSLKLKPENIKKSQLKIFNEIDKYNNNIKSLSDDLTLKETNFKEVQNLLKNMNEELIIARENKARQEGIYQEIKEKIKNDEKEIFEKLNITPKKFDTIIKQPIEQLSNLEECNLNYEKYNLQRDRIGPVNLVAEEDSKKLEEKLKEIEVEKNDLMNAINKLRTSISSINKEARLRLLNAFEEVNKHFKILFTDLFGGGEAYLKLEGSDDPLESGLELFASPPGKKLQNMTLLSGGEQALTSMALIFSVFLTKPSPICVLDEVDAPLDESNVERFLDLINAISNKTKTRFIVVTHHRLSMSRMDRLYGITMQEPGVSQLVSVSLKEAENYKAN